MSDVPKGIIKAAHEAAHPDTSTFKSKEGTWPEKCLQRAFVEGAKWWQDFNNGSTMFPSEREEAEAEAVKRYGEPTGEENECNK